MSTPISDSLNPFWPDALPWQPPLLQPNLLNMRLDVVGKIDGTHHAITLHFDRHADRQLVTVGRIGRAHLDIDSSIAGRNHHAVVNPGDLRIGRTIFHLVRHVGHAAVRAVGGDHQLHAFVGGAQRHRGRFDRQMVELAPSREPRSARSKPVAGRRRSRERQIRQPERRGPAAAARPRWRRR